MNELFTLIVTLFAVAFIIYLSYLFSKYISKGSTRINKARYMNVIDRLMVGQDRFILIISVQDKFYLVSVTSQSVQILKELQSDGFEDIPSEEKGGLIENSFKNVLQNIMKPRK